MKGARRALLGGLFLLALALGSGGVATATTTPWLFVTDVHFDPLARRPAPASYGLDTNQVLLDAALAEMQRVDPHPPVVVIDGDNLAHDFDWPRAAATMRYLARRFDAAFPSAQFVIALGNEDSSCGDYAVAPHSKFLRDVERAWEPLVNRRGAAPAFATTFARDGFYTARLPLANTTAVVIDDVFWSPRYRSCAPSGNPAAATIDELLHALHETPDRHWIVLHIPPGVDAYSTAHLAHRLVVVPFLDPRPRDALLGLVADPASHVTLILAAHSHKFAYRIVGTPARPVPLLLIPSVSPIFRNAPAFLTANVDPDGTLRDIHDDAFLGGAWHELGGFPALGVSRFTGPALVDLHRRLARDPALRDRFEALYESGAPSEIDAGNWPVYWCSATAFTSTAFRACAGEGGLSVVTFRGIEVVGMAAFAIAGTGLTLLWYRWMSRPVRA